MAPHPVLYTILYLPFGAMSGFVSVALTFLATRHGLSIAEGSLLNAAHLLTSWMKWSWAPIVDITLSPKRWYLISTTCSAVGIFAMAAIPLSQDTLWLVLGIIAVASLINSMVGMSIEAIIAELTPPEQQGRVSAWFQAGNLGGAGLGGFVGLVLLNRLPEPWMAGGVLAVAFLLCSLALLGVPHVAAKRSDAGPMAAVAGVFGDILRMGKSKGGLLSGLLCCLPLATGAAAGTLSQAAVASHWGAGETEVALIQGLFAAGLTAGGAFAGGWLCTRFPPRTAYAWIGLGLAGIAAGMALSPATVTMYIAWMLLYQVGIGLAYAAFTAFVLEAIGRGSAATKYNLYASLSNFPLWWLGLILGYVANEEDAPTMLLTEAGLGVLAVLVFLAATRAIKSTSLPDTA